MCPAVVSHGWLGSALPTAGHASVGRKKSTKALSVVMVLMALESAPGWPAVLEPGEPLGRRNPYCRVGDDAFCAFDAPNGRDRYEVTKRDLVRREHGTEVYRVRVAGPGTVVRLVASSGAVSLLAVGLDSERVSSRSLIMGGGPAGPSEVQRQYLVSLRNPKSGEEVKRFSLGLFRPAAIAMTDDGVHLLALGEELQTRARQIRLYDLRSGGLLEQLALAAGVDAYTLSSDGVISGEESYRLVTPRGSVGGRHRSSNPYSIAEFELKAVKPLPVDRLASAAVAVLDFRSSREDLGPMLAAAAQVKLRSAGIQVVERARLRDLLSEAKFQNLGVTDFATAAELGRLANATFVVFGTFDVLGSVASLSLRLVGVESGLVESSVEMECRDCREEDYLEALGWAVTDWVGG